jgi:hypothetical protein
MSSHYHDFVSSSIVHALHHVVVHIQYSWSSGHARVYLFLSTLAVVSLTLYFVLFQPLLSRIHLRGDFTWYDLGLYGLGPTRTYRSFDAPMTDVEFRQRDVRCGQDPIFFAPRGPATEPGGVILGADGELIWRQYGFGGDIQDFRVQEYRGERFLTFWAGKEDGARKEGFWYMVSFGLLLTPLSSAPWPEMTEVV